jgi:hypothetical protein
VENQDEIGQRGRDGDGRAGPTDGLVSGDTVPITVVEQIADQSAQAAVRAEEMLDRSSGGRPRSRLGVGQRPPTLPPSLLERLARDAVDASSEGARET